MGLFPKTEALVGSGPLTSSLTSYVHPSLQRRASCALAISHPAFSCNMRYSAGNKRGIAKFPRVLKQVAKAPLQLRSVNPRGAFRTPRTQPQPGEEAIVILRVQVLSCKDLVARDKGGTSDPSVIPLFQSRRGRTIQPRTPQHFRRTGCCSDQCDQN